MLQLTTKLYHLKFLKFLNVQQRKENLSGKLEVKNAVIVEARSEISAGGVIILHARNRRFENMAGLPQPRALIHILIQPFIADGEPELLNQTNQLGVKRPEGRQDMLEKLERHEILRQKHAIEVVDASGEEVVEAIDRSG